MIDPFKNIALLPASVVFDSFMSSLDEVGDVRVGAGGMFSIFGATMADYRRHYEKVLSRMVRSLSRHAKKIVFVDECLPQNCIFRKSDADDPRLTSSDNVTRWKVAEDLDIPADEINHMTLVDTRRILAKSRKVVYFANRVLCEKYLADGIKTALGERLVVKDYGYSSGQWSPASVPPEACVGTILPLEPFAERRDALEYLWTKLS